MQRPSLSLVLLLAAACWSRAQAAEGYANCAGYIDSLPATLATQGVWCLRKDLSTAITSGAAITVTANNVTIDCNDFKLGGLAAGPASTASGIHAVDRINLAVRRCNVRGFLQGIYLQGDGTSGALVEDNRFDNNLQYGILVYGSYNLVRRNRVYDTGGATGRNQSWGIVAFAHVADNTVDGVFALGANASVLGIQMGAVGSEARGNLVRGLMPSGAGQAIGIIANGVNGSVMRNRIVAPVAVAGQGVVGISTAATTCGGNLVARFSIPWSGCDEPAGNGNTSH